MNRLFKNGYADVSIGQLHYTLCRNPAHNDGSTLVMLNSRARSSAKAMPFLDSYERIFSIDLPAFGMSSPMPAGCSMHDIAGTIAEFIAGLGVPQIDLFGLHSGHKVASALSADWPGLVRRAIIAGRTHSIIPDQSQRHRAMKRVMDENQPDISILRMEGKYIDELGGPIAFANIFEANFAFDFASAMRKIQCPTLILEILSDQETALYGEQAKALAVGMKDVRTQGARQTDPTGLDLYIGAQQLAECIANFMDRRGER